MEFSIALNEFQKLLQKALPAIPPKSTLPVLEHLLFELNDNNLRITATDQDITIIANVEVKGIISGSVLVPGRKLDSLLKVLNSTGEVLFSANEESYELVLKVGRGSYKMKGLDPEEYLNIPELFSAPRPEINPEAGVTNMGDNPISYFLKTEIVRLTTKTGFAASKDEYRPAMTGVFFQLRGNYVNAVATDSFRLVRCTVRSEKEIFQNDVDVIIPERTVDLLSKAEDNLYMTLIETNNKVTHVRFDIGSMIFVTRIIDEKFPPYESVLPAKTEFESLFDYKEMLSAIKRVSLFTNINTKQIRLKLDSEQILLVGEDDDTGNYGEEAIKAEYKGEPVSIGFNWKYLEEALQRMNPDSDTEQIVKLCFNEPNKPILFKPNDEKDELVMLIMPMKLNN